MFVRAKTIKGIKYGYLVENKWQKGKVKQTVKKYLGKINPLPTIEDVGVVNILQDKKPSENIQNIIINDLLSRGFTKKNKTLIYENICVNLEEGTIIQKNKPCVIILNKRYVYGGLLRELIDFFEPETNDDKPGRKLAKAFRNAGIVIPKESFIDLYKLLYAKN